MSQSDFGTINPNADDGTDLASDLNAFRDALHSMHSGSSRPSYVAAGMMWIDTTTSAAWIVKIYDGTDDITFAVIDTTNNRVRLAVDADGDSYVQRGTTDDELEVVVSGSVVGKFTGTGWVPTTASAARDNLGISSKVLSKSANYTVTTADRSKLIRGTAALTLTLPAEATAGDGFLVHVKGDGGAVTVNDDAASAVVTVRDGASVTVRCDGSAWHAEDTNSWALVYLDAIEPVGANTTIKRVGGTNTTPIVEGLAKAWVNLNGTGTIALRDSFNVTSVTDNGTGDYTFNLTNDFANVDYKNTVSCDQFVAFLYLVSGRAVGSTRAGAANSGGTFTDSDNYNVDWFGDLA